MEYSIGAHIGSLMKKKLKKSDFKILNAPSLFVDWSNLDIGLCPFCGHRLYMIRGGKFFKCKSKTHRKAFVISAQKLYRSDSYGEHKKLFHMAIDKDD